MAINERNYVGFAVSPTTGRPHRIRHLPRMAEWEPGVYLWEEGDKFVGGIDGIDNLPTQQLANRTEYLYRENVLLKKTCTRLIEIAKETAPGKTSGIGYTVTASSKAPEHPCLWIRPQPSRQKRDTQVLSFRVSVSTSPVPCAQIVPQDGLGTLLDARPLIRSDIGDIENPMCEIAVPDVRASLGSVLSEGFQIPLGETLLEEGFRIYAGGAREDDAEEFVTMEDAVPVIAQDDGVSFELRSGMLRTQEGANVHIGTEGSFPRIPYIIGTVGAVLSGTNLMAGGAWIRPSEDIGQEDCLTAQAVLEDGTMMDGFTAMVVNEADEVYYVQFIPESEEPLYDPAVELTGYELATRRDIDRMLARI